MHNQSLSKQILTPDSQNIKQLCREGLKYQELLTKLEQDPFYDDSLFFDKKNVFDSGNPNHKKFKTIYHKIILSNKSDPLHPSSYRRFESSQQARYQRNKLNFDNQKFADDRLKIQLNTTNRSRIDVLESIRQKLNSKEQNINVKDRKRFFHNLFKKFTEITDQDTSVDYRQKAHLFRKIFDHYKIKPQERQQFEDMLKKMTEKNSESWAVWSKISTKMNLELRNKINSVSERRTESPNNPSQRVKQKNIKSSNHRRTPKQGNISHILSVNAKASRQEQLILGICSSKVKRDQKDITQLEYQLSPRHIQNKTIQEEANRSMLMENNQNRTRVLEKRFNIPKINQSIRQQTPIDIKLQKFRQFLFALNFSNHLFVPLQVDKYTTHFKIFIGKGNNSNLIKSIFKKRFWFEITKNINEANLIWTQLKEEHVFERQQPKRYVVEKQKKPKLQHNQDNQLSEHQKFYTQQAQGNPQEPNSPLKDDEHAEAKSPHEKQKQILQQNRILNFKSLKLKERINISKFVSVESERFYRSQIKGQKGSKQLKLQQNSLKMRKYPQLITLKNTEILSKEPLAKILSPIQMAQYNELYAKYFKNPFKIQVIKIPSFEQRKKDVMTSANSQAINQEDKHQIVIQNHLPFNGILGNKKAMFYILREYCMLVQRDVFSIVPLTFHIKHGLKDEEYKKFAYQFESRKKSNKINYWVMKPGEFSNRGNGIQCTNKIQYIRKRINACAGKVDPKRPKVPLSSKSIILQSYITDLLLYNGRKFDIRTYMMVTVVNGKMKAYWYEEGYIRTSSYIWNLADIEDREIHLTNDAVQKYSDTYGKYEPGNKLSYREIQRYLETYEKASKNVVYDKILPKMKEIAALSLKASYLFLDPSKLQNNFQIFGFDFMLDTKLKPWLIEINTNPCLELGCSILERIIPNMLENAFRIAIDPVFPPPSSFSSNYKYNIAENAVNYNKFELIFDEDMDGPEVKKLYQNKSLEQILARIEDIQEDKDVFQEDGEELDLSQKI